MAHIFLKDRSPGYPKDSQGKRQPPIAAEDSTFRSVSIAIGRSQRGCHWAAHSGALRRVVLRRYPCPTVLRKSLARVMPAEATDDNYGQEWREFANKMVRANGTGVQKEAARRLRPEGNLSLAFFLQ
jgi:hypothetical protein